MNRYPYFVFDFLLLVFLLCLIPLALFYDTTSNYALALASWVVFGVVFIGNRNSVRDFDAAVKGIKGIRSWQSNFLSVGTLRLNYKGENVSYSSLIRQRFNGGIPVDYSIVIKNGSRTSFEVKQKKGKPSMTGDKRFLRSLKKEIDAFGRKYGVRRIRNSAGLLRIDVRREFTTDNMGSDRMSVFLKDYLELGYRVNRKLKGKR